MTEVAVVIVLECPWCSDDLSLEPRALEPPAEEVRCAACGTTIAFVEEPAEAVPLAA